MSGLGLEDQKQFQIEDPPPASSCWHLRGVRRIHISTKSILRVARDAYGSGTAASIQSRGHAPGKDICVKPQLLAQFEFVEWTGVRAKVLCAARQLPFRIRNGN